MLTQATNAAVSSVSTKLKAMDVANKELTRTQPGSSEVRIRGYQHGTLTRKFVDLMSEYQVRRHAAPRACRLGAHGACRLAREQREAGRENACAHPVGCAAVRFGRRAGGSARRAHGLLVVGPPTTDPSCRPLTRPPCVRPPLACVACRARAPLRFWSSLHRVAVSDSTGGAK